MGAVMVVYLNQLPPTITAIFLAVFYLALFGYIIFGIVAGIVERRRIDKLEKEPEYRIVAHGTKVKIYKFVGGKLEGVHELDV